MRIIDSLFVGNRLFLFGSGVENPFSFASAARIDRFVCKLEGTQPGAIVRLVGSEHGAEGVQKLPHDSDNRIPLRGRWDFP